MLENICSITKMRSVCSFPGCKSGSASEKRNNKLHCLKNKTMFKFPRTDKFTFIRQKWEDVIGRKAKDTEVLCELHFRSEDIRRKYETLLSSGVKHTMERGKVSLNPTAVPQGNVCNNKEFEDNEPRTATVEICLNQSLQKTQEKPIILDQSFENAEESIDTSTIPPSSTSIKESENDININSHTSESCSKTNESESFSLKILNHSLKQIKFPEGWSYLKLMFLGRGCIIVGNWHANRPAQKEFVINVDGSVDVFINKKSVSIPGIKPGTTINNVINNIQVLKKILLCDGTIVAERYSDSCKGYVLPNQAHFKYGRVRCVSCKKLIAKSSRQQKKQLSRSTKEQIKRHKSRKIVKNEKVKNKKMKTKLVELKAEVARLKRIAKRQIKM